MDGLGGPWGVLIYEAFLFGAPFGFLNLWQWVAQAPLRCQKMAFSHLIHKARTVGAIFQHPEQRDPDFGAITSSTSQRVQVPNL